MTTPYNRMDPRYTGETSKHLEKQNELLWDAYRSMFLELHKLQKEDVNDILDELMKRKNDTLEGSKAGTIHRVN